MLHPQFHTILWCPEKTLAMLHCSLLSFLFHLFFLHASGGSGTEEFVYSGFTNDELALAGEASIERSRLALTTGLDTGVVAHAFYKYPISFKKLTNGAAATPSFTMTFVFFTTNVYDNPVEENPLNKDSGGLAIALSSTDKFLPGQYLALFNSSNRGNYPNNLLSIQLDTNLVRIDIFNSDTVGTYTPSDGFKPIRPYMYMDREIQMWVDYDGKTQLLNVTLGGPSVSKPEDPLLSSTVNLSAVLPSVAYVGFSALTRTPGTRYFILGWSFKKDGEAQPLNYYAPSVPADAPEAMTPFVVPPGFYFGRDAHSHSHLSIILPVVTSLLFAFLAIFAILGYLCKRRPAPKKVVKQEELAIKSGPACFRYKDLVNATGGFRDRMLLGEGGFGRVYKGVLPASNQCVAIKRISPQSKQGMKEFMSEISILGHVHHRSLVQLLGYCQHKHELLLVYNYMPNGSLDKYLYGQDKPALGWSQRFRIIRGVASGLFYLHEEWEHVVIHRDIKSSNVLLDNEMNGRLGDFGLARVHGHGVDARTTHVAGTCGYLAPELSRLGKATKATDVFAFGVFMMEVACGRKPIEVNAHGEPQVLADHVQNTWQSSSILSSIDPRLEDFVAQEVELVLKLGLLCTQPLPKVRPCMRMVMEYLERDAALPDFTLSTLSTDAINGEFYDQHVVSYPSVATTITSLSGGR